MRSKAVKRPLRKVETSLELMHASLDGKWPFPVHLSEMHFGLISHASQLVFSTFSSDNL